MNYYGFDKNFPRLYWSDPTKSPYSIVEIYNYAMYFDEYITNHINSEMVIPLRTAINDVNEEKYFKRKHNIKFPLKYGFLKYM